MDWQEAHRARLLADVSLAALIGTRIDWVERPKGKPLPAVTLQSIADAQDQNFKGFEGLQPARVQYDIWADTYASAVGVKSALLGDNAQPGPAIAAHTGNGHVFARGMVELAPRDLPDRISAGDGAAKTIFRISMDLIHYHALHEGGS